jgi:hypothetical protein
MKTNIEIIKANGNNQAATIISKDGNRVTIENHTLGTINSWNIEDIKNVIKYI